MGLRWTRDILASQLRERTEMNAVEPSHDRIFDSRRRIRRIGLLSPTSGNLGNATMQAAMIANLRKRIPGIEIVGITLNPDETRRRHEIEAFPLAAVSRPYYTLIPSNGLGTRRQPTRAVSSIKEQLKRIPVLGAALRTIGICNAELAHIRAVARFVSKLDGVLIPGGGALDDFWGGPWGQPWSLFKFAVLSRARSVPFLFVSVGKCSLAHPLSRWFARAAMKLAAYRSYRDSDSKTAVHALLGACDDPVYPDLAFSYPLPNTEASLRSCSQDGRLLIGVSPIAYCDPRAWPRKDEPRYREYVIQLAEMVKWLIRENHRVLFFTTDHADSETVRDVQTIIAGSTLDADAIQTLPGSIEQSPGSLLKGISRADLTIASRLHGVILSHLNATPVLALSFDPKVDAHMNAVGQKDYCLNIDHLSLDRLVERFTALKAARKQVQEHLNSVALGFRDLLDQQYDRILGAPFVNPMTDYNRRPIPQAEIGHFESNDSRIR